MAWVEGHRTSPERPLTGLRAALKASPDGERALALVRAELAKEHVDLDAVADREQASRLLKRKPRETGVHRKGTILVPISKGGTDRQAAQLADRHPTLADKVRRGEMTLNEALIEAGIRNRIAAVQAAQQCP